MRWFWNSYWNAFGLFAVPQVIADAFKSVWTAIKELAFVVASVVWVVTAPLLTFIEVFAPGTLDRMLFRAAR